MRLNEIEYFALEITHKNVWNVYKLKMSVVWFGLVYLSAY